MRRGQAIPTLFLVTASMLAFEVALTRICSVLLQYHVSFAVVSLAVLGLGLGGFAAYLWVGHRSETIAAACTAALVGISPGMLLALLGLLRLPFAEHWAYLLFLILPVFACAGAFQALVLRALAAHVGTLYAADLVGGAAGALLAVVALDAFGGPVNTVLVLAVVAAAAAWLWVRGPVRPSGGMLPPGASPEPGRRRMTALAAGLVAIAAAALVAQVATAWLDVRYERAPAKLIHAMLQRTPQGAPHLVPGLRRWDASSRVDVLEMHAPRGAQRLVFIDGETPTAMLSAQPTTPGAASLDVRAGLPALPYRLLAPRSVLSIGSGGGYDVVVAKRFGAEHVDAVELNAGVLQVVAAARDFTGGVYDQPGVRVHHAEGRRFARAAPAASYDLVILVLAQSLAGNLREYALSENYLYTREAFADYLRVLRPGGAVALLVNDDALLQRLQRTAADVLTERGQPAGRCIAAVSSPAESPYDRLLLVRAVPFEPRQVEELARDLEAHHATILHLPDGSPADGAVGSDAGVTDATAGQVPGLVPATDDRPFVFHLQGGVPRALRILLLTAGLALVAALAALTWVVRAWNAAGEAAAAGAAAAGARIAGQAAYFVLLGLGFMMVEVLVLQKSLLVIGHPTWNLGVVLATFLLAAGLGSAASARLVNGARWGLGAVLVLVAAGSVLLVRALEVVHAHADGLGLATRCIVLGVVVFPTAFLMGMPFPAGVRRLDPHAVVLVPWFWGLNGVASILGSALVVAVVLETGFRTSAFLPALCYLGAVVCSAAFRARASPGSEAAAGG